MPSVTEEKFLTFSRWHWGNVVIDFRQEQASQLDLAISVIVMRTLFSDELCTQNGDRTPMGFFAHATVWKREAQSQNSMVSF